MSKFVWTAAVLQVIMVVAGHFNEFILYNLSAALGVGIPLVIGLWYGVSAARTKGEGMKGGFIIGIVGAVIGVLIAILMGDQPWSLMTFAPPSSGITGLLGGLIGAAIGGGGATEEAA